MLLLILPLVTAPYVSRVLGAAGLGSYSYSNSIANYFVLIAMLGVNNYGNRSIAKVRDDKELLGRTFSEIWTLQLITSFVCMCAYLFYCLVLCSDMAPALTMIPLVLSAAFDVNWLFFGLEKFKVTVTRNFVIKLATFLLTFIIVRGEHAVLCYCALMALSTLASVLVLWPFVMRELKICVPSVHGVISHLKPNLVLFLPVIAISLYTVLDKIMLGQISGMSETGVFENSLKVAQMPFALIAALGTVMLPHASNLHATGKSDLAIAAIGPSMWFALLLSSAFTFGLIAVTPVFVPVFFGPGFEGCLIAMPLIVLEMPFMAWANVIRTQWLIPTGKDRAYVISVVVGAASNIIVNLCLIPEYGAIGAAVGTLTAEVAVCLVQTWAVRKDFKLGKLIRESIPSLTIGVLMCILVHFCCPLVGSDVTGLFMLIALGMLLFTLFSALWFSLSKNRHAETLLLPYINRKLGR